MLDTLRRRLILSHIVPILIIIPLMTFALIFILETQVILVNLSRQLLGQATLLSEFAANSPNMWQDSVEAQAFVDHFDPKLTAQLMLLDAKGRILAFADPVDSSRGQMLTNPGVATALAGENSVETLYDRNPRTEVVDVLLPVFNEDNEVIGIIRLAHRQATVQERFERLRSYIVQIVVIGSIVGIIVGYARAVTLEQPVKRLTSAIDQLASGGELTPLPELGPKEIRLLVNAFNSLVERLNMLRMARRQLLANLVHEVGRPLGAIRAATWSLINGASKDPTLRDELLVGMDTQLITLQHLLDDLSRFYDRALGALDLHRQPIALSEWLPVILAPWREVAQQKGVDWQTAIPNSLPTLSLDSDRLGQAIGNLMSNAIKFTPPEGTIFVEAGITETAVWIKVSDTGSGIAPEEQPFIFEPFFRSRHNNSSAEGMGLGLTITRDLIEAHDGRLQVETVLGQGSHFTLWLPLP
ncbi:MAG: HAMP domain-containing protein [Anaerolineales bacterium]|nr:HAMP domain-containing protein [Anaerolineales bacterium]